MKNIKSYFEINNECVYVAFAVLFDMFSYMYAKMQHAKSIVPTDNTLSELFTG